LAQGAAGQDDQYFRSFAEQLVQGGQAAATIRIGWEMTGDWFAWTGAKDPADWVGAYRSAVTAMRSVAGQQFTFDWNVSLGFADPVPLYPGDAYVDLIGADHYDASFGSISPSDHAAVWAAYVNAPKGLNWLAGFAKAHGKRMSFPEWGLSNRCDGHGGNDDPYFIQAMHDWMSQHDVAYEAYYESADAGVCATFAMSSGKFPEATALYRKLFGDGS
jgi:Glycosyl hydrolase family 26